MNFLLEMGPKDSEFFPTVCTGWGPVLCKERVCLEAAHFSGLLMHEIGNECIKENTLAAKKLMTRPSHI